MLLLHYLNRVHFAVIGIDSAFDEYIFIVDADTVSSLSSG